MILRKELLLKIKLIERNISNEFNSNEIFRASDYMVDALTKLLDRERQKEEN